MGAGVVAEMQMYDTAQVAEILHVTPQTVTLYIRAKVLPASKVGKRWLVAEDDLARYLSERGARA